MQCPDCHGTGMIVRRGGGPFFPVCQACGGYGMVHCCEGGRAADPPADDPPRPEEPEPGTRAGGERLAASPLTGRPEFDAGGQG